jgi:hypothetical protein
MSVRVGSFFFGRFVRAELCADLSAKPVVPQLVSQHTGARVCSRARNFQAHDMIAFTFSNHPVPRDHSNRPSVLP